MAYLDLNGLKRFKQKLVTYLGFIDKGSGRFTGDLYVHSSSPSTGDKVATEAYVNTYMSFSPAAINSFTVTPALAEIGTTVNASLAYTLSKVPVSAKLDNTAITIQNTSGTIAMASQTATHIWKLEITDTKPDGTAVTNTKTTKLTFTYRLYSGAAVAPAKLDDTFIRNLANKDLRTTQDGYTFSGNADSEIKYIWFACPESYGDCVFDVGGYKGGFVIAARDVPVQKGASNQTENYRLYKSKEPNLGSTSVTVTIPIT